MASQSFHQLVMRLLDDASDKPHLALQLVERFDEALVRCLDQQEETVRLLKQELELREENKLLKSKSENLENENASLRDELAALRVSRQDETTTQSTADASDDTEDLIHIEDDLMCDCSPARSISRPSSTAQELPDAKSPSISPNSFVLLDEASSPALSTNNIPKLCISDAAAVSPGNPQSNDRATSPSNVAIPAASLESDSRSSQDKGYRACSSSLELELGMELYSRVETGHTDPCDLPLDDPSTHDDSEDAADEVDVTYTKYVRPKEWVSEDEYPSARTEIFENEQHRKCCIAMHYDQSYCYPLPDELIGVFKYGIQYRPDTGVRNSDELALESPSGVFRTVTISGIPAGHQLRDVLQRVRGGAIHKATLADTRVFGQGMTAMVKFASADDAAKFVRAANELATPKRATDIAYPWKVTLAETPTYPDRGFVAKAIKEKGATRCLEIRDCSIESMYQLLTGLRLDFRSAPHKVSVLEDVFFDHNGSLFLNFADIAVAIGARYIIGLYARYEDINPRTSYANDYCHGSVCELARPSNPISCGYMSFKDISLHCFVPNILTYRNQLGRYRYTFTVKALNPDDHRSKRLYHGHALPWSEDQMRRIKAKATCDACQAGETCDQLGHENHRTQGAAYYSLEERDMLNHPIVAPGANIWDYCDSRLW